MLARRRSTPSTARSAPSTSPATRSPRGSPSSAREIAADYRGLDPLLIAPLKSSVVFLADLTRRIAIPHTLDVIELAPYTGGERGGVRLLKDVDVPLEGRHVLVVEDVVDTGLTLHFLWRTLALREPGELDRGDAPRPAVPSPRRGDPASLRRVHRARRALRGLRARAGRALACASRISTS